MDSVRIDSFIHSLDFVEKTLDEKTSFVFFYFRDLKGELKLLKTFLLCARIWRDYVPSGSSDSLDSFVSRLKDAINENEQHLPSLGLRLNLYHVRELLYSSIKSFQRFKGEISKWYYTWLGYFSYKWHKDQLMEFIDTVLVNIDDLLYHIPVSDGIVLDQIEALNGNLVFFKNFIRFAELRGIEFGQLEELLCHTQKVALLAAGASYTIGLDFHKQDAKERDSRKHLTNKMLTGIHDPSIHKTNIEVLSASNLIPSSHTLYLERDKHILGDFADSLLFYVWKALTKGTNYMGSCKDQMPILYDGLRFLRTILKQHLDKVDELPEKVKNLIGTAVIEAGIAVCSLLVDNLKEGLAKDVLCNFLEKIKLIKVLTSTFIFSTTDGLGFMDFLLKNLNELQSCKVDSIAFAKDQIQTVQEGLGSLRSFLEKILDIRNQHENLGALWNRVLKVAYNLPYVIQSLVVGGITDSSSMILDPITDEINLIKIETLEIGDNDYCSQAQKASRTSNPFPSQDSITAINKVEVILYDEAEKIINQVTRGSKSLDIVSIVGMPGLGKTTLAKNVYNNPSVRGLFHIHGWGVVSQISKKKDLLLQILDCFVPHLSKQYSMMSESDLEEELRKRLLGNRYLIVLDDVWDSDAWSKLEGSFPNNGNGSRILLTSRHFDVAKKINPDSEPHCLRLLTEDESWELLHKNLSCKEGYDIQLTREIANKCKGLPLTVVIVAGLLPILEQDGWKEIAKRLSLSALSASDECLDMLDLSYGHLPNYLKSCLLYFAAFQEDHEISFGQLRSLWIAEGLVQESETKSLEDVARDYMNDLIGRNWVLVSKERSLGGVKTCRIHDLLHEFCVIKCKKRNFLCLRSYDELVTFNCQSDIRRWCVKVDLEQFEKSRLFCPSLRSLLFFPHDSEHESNTYRIFPLFCMFRRLQVLDFGESITVNSFPNEICLLVELRYLAFGAFFEYIPPSVADLSNLEFLLIKPYCRATLPITIWNMQKLRSLRGSYSVEGTVERSSDLQNLHTFTSLLVDGGPDVEKILRKMPNIRRLSFTLYSSRESIWDRILRMDFLSRLESLHVRLDSHLNEKLDHNIEFHFPLNLRKLTLTHFRSDIIPKINQLPKLEVLKLCYTVYEGNTWDMEEGLEFPQLKLLKLENLDILRWTGSDDHFPLLQKLVLVSCNPYAFPSCLEDISTLEMIEVCGCPDFVANLLQKLEEKLEGLKVLIF